MAPGAYNAPVQHRTYLRPLKACPSLSATDGEPVSKSETCTIGMDVEPLNMVLNGIHTPLCVVGKQETP